MALKRVYDNWAQVRAASGAPSSAARRTWREILRTRPAIAYWGDSWFSTPLYKNLYWNSFARIDGMSLRLGGPGLTAGRLCTPWACRDYARRLATHEFDLLCLSIGGNDALGAPLAAVFDGRRRMGAEAAFAAVVADGVFDRLRARYAVLLSAMERVGPHFRVVGHGYAPLHVGSIGMRGKVDIKNLGLVAPLIGNVGPWLWPVMRPVLGSKAETARFARLLLVHGFRDRVLAPSRDEFAGLFSYVDFSTLAGSTSGQDAPAEPSFWYDEIHPTEQGFAILAAGYNMVLRAALPAAKRHAVR